MINIFRGPARTNSTPTKTKKHSVLSAFNTKVVQHLVGGAGGGSRTHTISHLPLKQARLPFRHARTSYFFIIFIYRINVKCFSQLFSKIIEFFQIKNISKNQCYLFVVLNSTMPFSNISLLSGSRLKIKPNN